MLDWDLLLAFLQCAGPVQLTLSQHVESDSHPDLKLSVVDSCAMYPAIRALAVPSRRGVLGASAQVKAGLSMA